MRFGIKKGGKGAARLPKILVLIMLWLTRAAQAGQQVGLVVDGKALGELLRGHNPQTDSGVARRTPACFVPGLPRVILIELRQALISYQDYHMLLRRQATPRSLKSSRRARSSASWSWATAAPP